MSMLARTCSKIGHCPTLHLQQICADVVAANKCQHSAHDRGQGAGHEVVDTPQACRRRVVANKGAHARHHVDITPNDHGVQNSIPPGTEANGATCAMGVESRD